MKKNILVVGANGKLGTQMTEYLRSTHGDKVKIYGLVRDINKVAPMRSVEYVQGDLFDASSLVSACKDKYAVISCVIGDEKTFVQGQKNLFDAARSCGVQRFVPSDYTMDYRRLPRGLHPMKDWQRDFAEYADRHPDIGIIHIFIGCFIEVFFGFFGVWDERTKTLSYYGSGDEKIDLTTYRDTAAFTVEAVLNESMAGDIHVRGDCLNYKEMAAIYEEETRSAVNIVRMGSLDDLKAAITKLSAAPDATDNPWRLIQLQYQLYVINDLCRLHDLQNERFPEVKAKTFREFLQTAEV